MCSNVCVVQSFTEAQDNPTESGFALVLWLCIVGSTADYRDLAINNINRKHQVVNYQMNGNVFCKA